MKRTLLFFCILTVHWLTVASLTIANCRGKCRAMKPQLQILMQRQIKYRWSFLFAVTFSYQEKQYPCHTPDDLQTTQMFSWRPFLHLLKAHTVVLFPVLCRNMQQPLSTRDSMLHRKRPLHISSLYPRGSNGLTQIHELLNSHRPMSPQLPFSGVLAL